MTCVENFRPQPFHIQMYQGIKQEKSTTPQIDWLIGLICEHNPKYSDMNAITFNH